MLTRRFCLRFLLCLACLASTAFAQNTFSRHSYAATGNQLLRADFNRDGKPDLLGSTGKGINIFLNNGDGTFRGPVRTVTAVQTSLAPVDFNRDGRTDIAACRFENTDTSTGRSDLAIRLGNGAGTFSQPRRFALPSGRCDAVATEDFNQDGKQDVAVIWMVRNPDFTPNNGITVFFGDGAGNASHSMTTDHITSISSDGTACAFAKVVAGNYDRSGAPDVVIATVCDNDTFSQSTLVFGRGTGTGQFGFNATDEVSRHVQPAKDDVNQDSRLDLVVEHRSFGPHGAGGSGVSFYLNRDSGGIPSWEKHTAQSYGGDVSCDSSVRAGVAVDLNNDAIKDAAYAEVLRPSDCSGTEAYRLSMRRGLSDGSYGAAQQFTLSAFPQDVASGDFDRDGRLDLAVAINNSTEVFLNRNNVATCTANSTLRTVKICAPASVSGNTLRLRANTTTGSPVTGMKVYVDGSEVFFTPNDTIVKILTLASGSHRLTVRAWDSQGSFSSTKTVTAGGS